MSGTTERGGPRAGVEAAAEQTRHERLTRTRHVLAEVRGHLGKRALHLLGFLVFAYLVLKLVPGLESALDSLKEISLLGVAALAAIEIVSETGYVFAWRGILDPERVLEQPGRGKHLATRVAWSQLGGGMIVPGGSLGSIGVGAWMLQRLGMSVATVTQRQLTLVLVNTTVDALAIVVFGVGLAIGLFGGSYSLALTLLPAAIVAVALALALFISRPRTRLGSVEHRWPRLAKLVSAIKTSVADTEQILRHRGNGVVVLGAVAYLLFDMLVLQGAFTALGAQDQPGLPVVAMCYLIGALGGSIPLPANLGAVGWIAGMLVLFGVNRNDAFAAVVVYQAIGYVVPLVGGGIAYLFLRGQFGSPEEHPDAEG